MVAFLLAGEIYEFGTSAYISSLLPTMRCRVGMAHGISLGASPFPKENTPGKAPVTQYINLTDPASGISRAGPGALVP